MTFAFRPSIACCSTPAIIGPPYDPEGQWSELDGTRIYSCGSGEASKALFILYDVFGYSSQILQGADRLAARGYRIYMPDFFGNQGAAPLTWMPMPEVGGKEPPADTTALDEFCDGAGNTEKTVEKVLRLRGMIQSSNPSIEKWGLVGYCWGGYVANFLLGPATPFGCAAELHPGFPAKEIAETITKPILALCSKDEPEDEYAHFKPHLKIEAEFVHFPSMLHGWMSARGDLQQPEVRKEFDNGYRMMADWFDKFL